MFVVPVADFYEMFSYFFEILKQTRVGELRKQNAALKNILNFKCYIFNGIIFVSYNLCYISPIDDLDTHAPLMSLLIGLDYCFCNLTNVIV